MSGMECENLDHIASEALITLSGKIGRHAADQFLWTTMQRIRGQISDEDYQCIMHNIFQQSKDAICLANWILHIHFILSLSYIRQTSSSVVEEIAVLQRFESLKIRTLPPPPPPRYDTTICTHIESLINTARSCNATVTSLLIDNDQKETNERTSESSTSSTTIVGPTQSNSSSSSSSESPVSHLLCQESLEFLNSNEIDSDDHNDIENSPKNTKSGSKSGRARIEWTEKEDLLFMEGLMLYGKSYERISKLIGTRNRAQVRQHYRYLAKSLRENNKSHTKTKRRIKVRGRPSRTKIASPSPTMQKLLALIEQIERNNAKSKHGTTSNVMDCDEAVDIDLSKRTQSPTIKVSGASMQSVTSENTTSTNKTLKPLNERQLTTRQEIDTAQPQPQPQPQQQHEVESPSCVSMTSNNSTFSTFKETLLLESSSEVSKSIETCFNDDNSETI